MRRSVLASLSMYGFVGVPVGLALCTSSPPFEGRTPGEWTKKSDQQPFGYQAALQIFQLLMLCGHRRNRQPLDLACAFPGPGSAATVRVAAGRFSVVELSRVSNMELHKWPGFGTPPFCHRCLVPARKLIRKDETPRSGMSRSFVGSMYNACVQ